MTCVMLLHLDGERKRENVDSKRSCRARRCFNYQCQSLGCCRSLPWSEERRNPGWLILANSWIRIERFFNGQSWPTSAPGWRIEISAKKEQSKKESSSVIFYLLRVIVAKKTDKPKRRIEPITSTLVVNRIKPEDDPIRYRDYGRTIARLISKYLPEAQQEKDAAEKIGTPTGSETQW